MAANLVTIGCRDECGSKVVLDTSKGEIEPPGWSWLPIQKRWRCPACANLLENLNARKQDDSQQG